MIGEERDAFKQLLDLLNSGAQHDTSIKSRHYELPYDMRGPQRLLELREAITTATGNIMAMDLAQAVADAPLDESSDVLERLTASINCDIHYTGLLLMEDKYAHDIRVSSLKNVGQRWSTISCVESANSFR